MFRLTLVFAVWVASTAYAGDEPDYEAQLHETYTLAWQAADDETQEPLNRSQFGWNVYRAANCALLGEDCYAAMAQQRASELRELLRTLVTEETCDDLTDRSAEPILPRDEIAEHLMGGS
jgi:hypothetical protein